MCIYTQSCKAEYSRTSPKNFVIEIITFKIACVGSRVDHVDKYNGSICDVDSVPHGSHHHYCQAIWV